MKTYRNLFPQIYDFENLHAAYRAARRAKRGRFEVMRFEQRVEDQLFRLQDELRAETYMPSGYRHFYIHEPKRRKISAAPFRDRVVHHALFNVIEPIWERRFIHDSYACRVGKGTHRALDRCTEWVRQYRYVLHSWHAEVRSFAAERLRLHLHEHKCQVYPTKAGVPFLGFRHFADHRRLKREGIVRFRRRCGSCNVIMRQARSAAIKSARAFRAGARTPRMATPIACETSCSGTQPSRLRRHNERSADLRKNLRPAALADARSGVLLPNRGTSRFHRPCNEAAAREWNAVQHAKVIH